MSWHLRWIILFWCVLSFRVNARHLLGFPTVAAGQDTSGNTLWICFLSVAEASPWLHAVCSEHVLSGLLEKRRLKQILGL